eukprot:m.53351 g.53351  ORF g.53351 m.53351 type:complete len:537 (+) comp10861_c0_seq2:79-1689(+)
MPLYDPEDESILIIQDETRKKIVEPIFSIKGTEVKYNDPNDENSKEYLRKMRSTPFATIETTGCSFSKDICMIIAEQLEKEEDIQVILMGNMFISRGIPQIHPSLRAFSMALRHAKFLTVVDFSDNALNIDGAKAICPLLEKCLTLSELYLSNTGVGWAGGEAIAEALTKVWELGNSLGTPYKLRRFVLGRSRLESSAKQLAQAFAKIGTLVELQIAQNGIFVEGIVAMAKAMACNKDLEILNLSDNYVKHSGGRAVARAIKNCPNMKYIAMTDTGLKNDGGLAVAQALASASKIEVLDLRFNDMTLKVAEALAVSLGDKKNLRVVNLNANSYGSKGRDLLKKSGSLGSVMPDPESDEEDDDEDEEDESEGEGEDDDVDFVDTPEEEYFGLKPPQPKSSPPIKFSEDNDMPEMVSQLEKLCVQANGLVPDPHALDACLQGPLKSEKKFDNLNSLFARMQLVRSDQEQEPLSEAALQSAWKALEHASETHKGYFDNDLKKLTALMTQDSTIKHSEYMKAETPELQNIREKLQSKLTS